MVGPRRSARKNAESRNPPEEPLPEQRNALEDNQPQPEVANPAATVAETIPVQTTVAEEMPTAEERARTPVGQIGATIASIPRQTQSSGSHRSRSAGTQMNTVVNDLMNGVMGQDRQIREMRIDMARMQKRPAELEGTDYSESSGR